MKRLVLPLLFVLAAANAANSEELATEAEINKWIVGTWSQSKIRADLSEFKITTTYRDDGRFTREITITNQRGEVMNSTASGKWRASGSQLKEALDKDDAKAKEKWHETSVHEINDKILRLRTLGRMTRVIK